MPYVTDTERKNQFYHTSNEKFSRFEEKKYFARQDFLRESYKVLFDILLVLTGFVIILGDILFA